MIENYFFSLAPSQAFLEMDQGVMVDTDICEPMVLADHDLNTNFGVSQALAKVSKENQWNNIGLFADGMEEPEDREVREFLEGQDYDREDRIERVLWYTTIEESRKVNRSFATNVDGVPGTFRHVTAENKEESIERFESFFGLKGMFVTEDSGKFRNAITENLVQQWFNDVWRLATIEMAIQFTQDRGTGIVLLSENVVVERVLENMIRKKYDNFNNEFNLQGVGRRINELFISWAEKLKDDFYTKVPMEFRRPTAREAVDYLSGVMHKKARKTVTKEVTPSRKMSHKLWDNNEMLIPFCPKRGVLAFMEPKRAQNLLHRNPYGHTVSYKLEDFILNRAGFGSLQTIPILQGVIANTPLMRWAEQISYKYDIDSNSEFTLEKQGLNILEAFSVNQWHLDLIQKLIVLDGYNKPYESSKEYEIIQKLRQFSNSSTTNYRTSMSVPELEVNMKRMQDFLELRSSGGRRMKTTQVQPAGERMSSQQEESARKYLEKSLAGEAVTEVYTFVCRKQIESSTKDIILTAVSENGRMIQLAPYPTIALLKECQAVLELGEEPEAAAVELNNEFQELRTLEELGKGKMPLRFSVASKLKKIPSSGFILKLQNLNHGKDFEPIWVNVV